MGTLEGGKQQFGKRTTIGEKILQFTSDQSGGYVHNENTTSCRNSSKKFCPNGIILQNCAFLQNFAVYESCVHYLLNFRMTSEFAAAQKNVTRTSQYLPMHSQSWDATGWNVLGNPLPPFPRWDWRSFSAAAVFDHKWTHLMRVTHKELGSSQNKTTAKQTKDKWNKAKKKQMDKTDDEWQTNNETNRHTWWA